jgi:hypothetical protein
MSYIACNEDCVYQKDGCCRLERVSDWQGASRTGGCLYRFPSSGQNGVDGLPYVHDGNEFQA